jgi:RimJ/RimL family protein N-acetyltransferase
MNKIFTNKKIKFITILAAIAAVGAISYFYIPKFWEQKTAQTQSATITLPTTKKVEFSHPDDRPEEIKGNIVTLKRLRPEYFQEYHKMCTPLVRKPLYFQTSYEWTKHFLEKELRKEAEGKILFYVIFDNKDNKLIGSLDIREKNPKDPGQFGCWLNENYWGGERMREAIKLISDAYFKLKKVDSFNAHVEIWNLRSYYALKKSGFKLVDFYYEDGKPTRYILEFYNPNKTKSE